jgi:2'-5' RNA ligase
MKVLQKYFLALVPPSDILEKVNEIKIALREQFGIKYALKSPPHVTLKMPFNYSEAKEDRLREMLEVPLKEQRSFPVTISGVGAFGNRVVYLNITPSEELVGLQSAISKFCKTQLHLVEELSDRSYHPHMTVAFKDLKASQFQEVFDFVSSRKIELEFVAEEVTILKRTDGKWKVLYNVSLR